MDIERGLTDICLNDMLRCMRTTLNLDDAVVRAVKKEALKSGRTMTEVIEDALRERLMRPKTPSALPFRLEMVTVQGSLNPGIDLNDRRNLIDVMEGRE